MSGLARRRAWITLRTCDGGGRRVRAPDGGAPARRPLVSAGPPVDGPVDLDADRVLGGRRLEFDGCVAGRAVAHGCAPPGHADSRWIA